MKQTIKSSVGPRLIGKSLERNKFEVERGMVSQAARDRDGSNLDLSGMW